MSRIITAEGLGAFPAGRMLYNAPKLRHLGSVKLTAMPGGSLGVEGNSGKQHKFAVGEDDNKFPRP